MCTSAPSERGLVAAPAAGPARPVPPPPPPPPPRPALTGLRVAPGGQCTFTLTGGTDALANAIRRAMLQDVRCTALSRVTIQRNDTPFPDELLAHRLGQVPLPQPGRTGRYRLQRAGPGWATSADLVPEEPDGGGEPPPPPAGPPVALCPLHTGQALVLTAESAVGVGSEHARFQLAVAPAYAARHAGADRPECWCDAVRPGADCAACGRRKPDAGVLARPVEHAFRFEAQPGTDPRDLLRWALEALQRKVAAARAGLAGGGGQAPGPA